LSRIEDRYHKLLWFHCRSERGIMPLIRSIGRWSLTALIINTVIGSGVFGLPSEVNAIVGRASPIAMILAGLGMGLVMACFAEVASQFSGGGGAYLYAKTALGDFVGMQVAWFSLLAPVGACAASVNLFVIYLAGFLPSVGDGAPRVVAMAILVGALTLANYVGVRSGTNLSNLFTISKLLPLAVLIVLGLWRFSHHPLMLPPSEIVQPGLRGWLDALLLLSFAYAGFETALIPAAEMKEPRKHIPAALGMGLLVCIGVYALVQFVVVATIGTGMVERPLSAVASLLVGSKGSALITVAAMISIYGSVSAMVLATPRLTYSMAESGEFPPLFATVHSRFKTPHISIAIFGALTLILAATGSFRWLMTLASGAVIIIYSAVCLSLIVLRRRHPQAQAMRIPAGSVVAVACLGIAIILLLRFTARESMMLIATALVASANFLVVRVKHVK
jgi:basic amino acid/polyamine antiporter, APA family